MKTAEKNIIFILLFVVLAAALPCKKAFPFGKNKVNREVYDFRVLKTVHFNIHYPAGMDDLAYSAAKIAEEGYVHIANSLCHEITDVIPVILYPSHIDFQENNVLMQVLGEGIGGFTESLKRRVVVPFSGSYIEFRHVLTHELVHAFQYNIMMNDESGGAQSMYSLHLVPLWMIEGMAEYLSSGFDETADTIMRDALYNDQYATLMDLTEYRVRSPYLFYKEGQAFYYYLERKFGRDRFGELLRDIRDVRDLDEALRISTGMNLEELNLDWIRFYKKRYYPVISGKTFDEEGGERLTDHVKTGSFMNVSPAVSPDGKKIAFITNMDIYAGISIVDITKKTDRKFIRIVRGENNSRFEGMHLMNNYLSWSADGAVISFVAQSNGRDVIYLVDAGNGSVINKYAFPFRAVTDPSLSPDRSFVAFVGQGNSQSDVYLYNISTGELHRLTDDRFSERHPRVSRGGTFVVYSTNRNDARDYERKDYNIVRRDMASGTVSVLVNSPGNDLQSDISPDGRMLLYISDRNGIFNACRYDMEKNNDVILTNIVSGIYYPRWFPDGKTMAYVSYQNMGYDIFTRQIPELPVIHFAKETETIREEVRFPVSYFPLSRSVHDSYAAKMTPDYVLFGLGATLGYGFAGFAQFGMSDYLGDHRIMATVDYMRYARSNNMNFDVAYYYLKQRLDYGIGIFRQRNPYGFFSLMDLSTINDLIHNVYFNTLYLDHYGVYLTMSYPFTRFVRANLQFSSSRYERDYTYYSNRPDTFANLNKVSASLNYDNVLWAPMVPVDGFRGQVAAEQAVDITSQDFCFTTLNADLRRYFLVRCFDFYMVFALRGSGGRVFGRDSEYFKYYLGGFNTLRGHPFLAYGGNSYFMGNFELRFIAVERIKLGFPLFFEINNIGGVIFIDTGSAWDGRYHFMSGDGRSFGDFKTDMGFGFRLTLYPVVILKLDFAWPYYYRKFGERQLTFSLGFEY